MPAGYDREYTTPLDGRTQLRVGFSTTRGRVTRFVVQLEYWLDGDWRVVARFDHDERSEMGHDVTQEGLHLDLYRDGEKYAVKDDYPPVDLNDAIDYCETELRENATEYVTRFERWHDVNPANR